MICPDCKKSHHGLCRRGTWCDCQHRGPDRTPVAPAEDKIFTPAPVAEHVDLLALP